MGAWCRTDLIRRQTGPGRKRGTIPFRRRALKETVDEFEQPLGAALRGSDRDDHDRQPAVLLDAVRQSDSDGYRVEALRDLARLHAVHPVPDVGAAARRMAHRL